MKLVKAILKHNTNDVEGFIYIMCVNGRLKRYVSLKIKIPVKLWSDETRRVIITKKVDYKSINKLIENKITELEETDIIRSNKNSFIIYFEKYNTRINKHGSRIKYEQVLNKLKQFKSDILFNEIDVDFIYKLQTFLLIKQSNNTANHYLKLIRQVLNTAIKENVHNYYRHPFLSFTFKYNKVYNNSLNENEVNKIINCSLDFGSQLYDTRNKFIFQIFAQGMRCSDLMLLKFSNIIEGKIVYNMVKTKKPMKVELNEILTTIILHQIKKLLINQRDYKEISLFRYERELNELTDTFNQYTLDCQIEGEGYEDITDRLVKLNDIKYLQMLEQIESKKHLIAQVSIKQLELFCKDKKLGNNYIFDFVDFDIKDVDRLTESEYKKLKSKSIVYNRDLKQLQAKTKSAIVYKTHLSRHTYASLLLKLDTHLYIISQSLGHSRLAITDLYLSNFDASRTGEANIAVSSMFKINY